LQQKRQAQPEEGYRSLRWGQTHGAIFDQAKAQFLWLTKGKAPEEDFPFGTQQLKPMSEVKWLGVWLDRKLLFNKHFRVLEEKAQKTLNQLRIFGNSRWGTKEADRIKLIKCVLFPRITYGAALWATEPNKGKVNALAEKVDRLAGIYSLGVFKSTASTFIQNRLGVQPFLTEAIRTSFSFYYRKIVTIKLNNVVRSFILSSRASSSPRLADAARIGLATKAVSRAVDMDPELIHLNFECGSQPSRNLDYKNMGMSKEDAIHSVKSCVSLLSSDPGALLVFSDGSYHPEKGGAGAAICPVSNTFSSNSTGNKVVVSNHESEAVGILAAIGLAKEMCVTLRYHRLLIFVDNQGVISRMAEPNAPRPGQWIFQCIDNALLELPQRLKVAIVWCPGHKDILGNELADHLAKEALESPSTPSLAIKSNFRKVQRMAMDELMVRRPAPSGLPIGFTSLINQLDSGHCALKKHLFRICRSLDPLCPHCGARETVFHFMNFCPKFKNQRWALRRHLRHLKVRFKAEKLDRILNNRKADEAVAKFLQDSNRFTEHLNK
jgi:ribonuclease HI